MFAFRLGFQIFCSFFAGKFENFAQVRPIPKWAACNRSVIEQKCSGNIGEDYIQSFIFRRGKIVQYLNLMFLQQILDLRK